MEKEKFQRRKITIYTQSTCGYCKQVKDELEKKGMELGVELYKRKSKYKLIAEIEKLLKKG